MGTKRPTLTAPPPPTAPEPLPDYEQGMLDALRLMKEARTAMEEPLRTAAVGAAYVALNGVTHWGQTLTSHTETLVLRHLMERREALRGATETKP